MVKIENLFEFRQSKLKPMEDFVEYTKSDLNDFKIEGKDKTGCFLISEGGDRGYGFFIGRDYSERLNSAKDVFRLLGRNIVESTTNHTICLGCLYWENGR